MPLESMKILGFRGFKSQGVVDFAVPNGLPGSGLTVLTGANNSGKSSILECMKFRSGAPPSFSVGTRNAAVEYVEIEYNISGQSETITSKRKGASETNRSESSSNLEIFVLPSRRSFDPYFMKNTMTRMQYQSSYGVQPKRQSTLSGFENRLFKILDHADSFNKLVAKALGYEPDWSIDQSDQGAYFLKFFNGGSSHSSDGMGEGVISVFSIVDSLYDSAPGSVIVIDEPELSIHPALQKRLSNLLMDFSADRQIVISTHSPHFIDFNSLQSGGKLSRVVSSEEGTKIFQLSNESIKAIGKLTKRNIYNPHVFGLEAKELFFQDDGIVLTEGQEDVLLYPLVADQVGSYVSGNFFGWGAGGASNISHLCVILRDLGFKRVAAILDGDKRAEMGVLKTDFPEFYFNVIPASDIRTKLARSASQPVEGILNESWEIHPQYIEAMKVVFSELNAHIAPTALTLLTPPAGEPAGATDSPDGTRS